jgi:hypothetical protein
MNVRADAGISDRIQRAVTEGLNQLPLWLRWWVRAHLVEPRAIMLCTDADTGTCAAFWQITDHVGLDDAPFRIVYDGSVFGLEMRLEDGVSYLVHRAASFAEAVECM